MRARQYILDEHGEPVACRNIYEWSDWFEHNRSQRIVKQEMVGKFKVSTVFLALDHNWNPNGPPVLWETMVFPENSANDLDMDRCSGSREQAMAMHERMVEKVKSVGVTDS